MQHVAIDLGSKHSQVCIRAADGTLLTEKKHLTVRLDELMSTWERSVVVLETSSEAFRIADQARQAGHVVKVVPSILTKQLGVGERKVKTDTRDARKLSEVSCRIDLPSVHVPTKEARELRSAVQSRRVLIETRTKNVNNVKGWLRTQLLQPRKGTTETLPERVRDAAQAHHVTVPAPIERALQLVELLNQQAKESYREFRELAMAHPVCARLMTIPGVGPITALSFIATVDDPTRFPCVRKLQSYLGLTPGENSSSQRQQRTGITKAGPSAFRQIIVQAAWTAWRHAKHEPMVQWAQQIMDRRSKPVAVVALARKMTGIMFALWRDGTTYRATPKS